MFFIPLHKSFLLFEPMAQYNPEVYARAPATLGMSGSTMAFFEKRARLALQDSGYTPSASSQLNESPSSSTGEVSTTNYTGTSTYVTVPYTLTFKDNVGLNVSETKNWTEKIRPGTFTMLRAAQTPAAISGTASPPVLLTLPQVNYQLHCEMRGRMREMIHRIQPRDADEFVALNDEMKKAWREVMNMALQWVPAGVMQTSHDHVPTPSLSTAYRQTKVVQVSGVAFVQNIWGGSVCCGSTLWLRLGTAMHRASDSKTYVLGENDVATVPAIELDYYYRVPRFEAVVSNIGHSIGTEHSVLKLDDAPVAGILRSKIQEPFFEMTEVYKIGMCFDLSGLARRVRSSAAAPVRANEVSMFEHPGMTNQIQILLSGEM